MSEALTTERAVSKAVNSGIRTERKGFEELDALESLQDLSPPQKQY